MEYTVTRIDEPDSGCGVGLPDGEPVKDVVIIDSGGRLRKR